ncbi:MAG: nitrate reductase [Synechococcus sp. SB0678_bin_12]|nr:nitrate reductase associated protein [Cyanobacteria bacterium MAG IRC1_bin_28]MYF36834.1 nitrate reductase [Synechococcus sp. SB0678_bin_12]MYI88300.1 nitrate reductase [Synechococcus sp. SB0672_bin_10]
MWINEASRCFDFEADFMGSWRCIPLCVRRKLDLAGIKLKLRHWLALDHRERQQLVDWPDGPEDLRALAAHLKQRTAGMMDGPVGELPIPRTPLWRRSQPPGAVTAALGAMGRTMNQDQWRRLSELERFSLCKLARPGHDHHNLAPALAEFKVR